VAGPAAAHERPSRSHSPSAAAHPGPTRQLWTQLPSLSSPTFPLLPHDAHASSHFSRIRTKPSAHSNLTPSLFLLAQQQPTPFLLYVLCRHGWRSRLVILLASLEEQPRRHPLPCVRLRCSSCAGDKSSPPLFYRLFFFLYTAAMAAPGAECWRPKPPLVPRPSPCKAARALQAELTSLLRCRHSAAPHSASNPSPLAALPAQVPGQRGALCCEAPA
jgi:hypothetical protein